MKLEINIKAPVFKLKDIFGREIDLDQYRSKRIFIGFFRHAGCPFCNIRVHALLKKHEELKELGLEMIFFFESPENLLLKSIFHKEVSPIPLISDPKKTIYSQYGVENSGYKSAASHLTSFVQTAFKARQLGVPTHLMAGGESISTIPAEFLLDYDLNIKKVHYATSLNDRLDIEILYAFAKGANVQ
jgi:thioredoxin-dependent peroxiredoxin